jgi:hypothetical protein
MEYEKRKDIIMKILKREWSLEMKKMIIKVKGGKEKFEMKKKIKKIMRKGMLKDEKTTGAWIFTGGTNTGVTRR